MLSWMERNSAEELLTLTITVNVIGIILLGSQRKVSVGKCAFDPVLLCAKNVSMCLWRVKYCSSYLLVLKLEHSHTVDKLCSLVSAGEDPVIISILCLSL